MATNFTSSGFLSNSLMAYLQYFYTSNETKPHYIKIPFLLCWSITIRIWQFMYKWQFHTHKNKWSFWAKQESRYTISSFLKPSSSPLKISKDSNFKQMMTNNLRNYSLLSTDVLCLSISFTAFYTLNRLLLRLATPFSEGLFSSFPQVWGLSEWLKLQLSQTLPHAPLDSKHLFHRLSCCRGRLSCCKLFLILSAK